MSEIVQEKMINALNMVAQANSAMIDAIETAVNENEEVSYIVRDENNEDLYEEYTISVNEDGVLMAYDSEGWDYKPVEDMTANELFNICVCII